MHLQWYNIHAHDQGYTGDHDRTFPCSWETLPADVEDMVGTGCFPVGRNTGHGVRRPGRGPAGYQQRFLLLLTMQKDVTEDILRRLKRAPVVPLVAPDNAESAIRTTRALVDGGLSLVEVVLRTPAVVQCLGEIGRAVAEAIIGAGTVLSVEQAEAVMDEGARFIVLPGL